MNNPVIGYEFDVPALGNMRLIQVERTFDEPPTYTFADAAMTLTIGRGRLERLLQAQADAAAEVEADELYALGFVPISNKHLAVGRRKFGYGYADVRRAAKAGKVHSLKVGVDTFVALKRKCRTPEPPAANNDPLPSHISPDRFYYSETKGPRVEFEHVGTTATGAKVFFRPAYLRPSRAPLYDKPCRFKKGAENFGSEPSEARKAGVLAHEALDAYLKSFDAASEYARKQFFAMRTGAAVNTLLDETPTPKPRARVQLDGSIKPLEFTITIPKDSVAGEQMREFIDGPGPERIKSRQKAVMKMSRERGWGSEIRHEVCKRIDKVLLSGPGAYFRARTKIFARVEKKHGRKTAKQVERLRTEKKFLQRMKWRHQARQSYRARLDKILRFDGPAYSDALNQLRTEFAGRYGYPRS